MKQFNSATFNNMAILCQDTGKLIPMTEVVFLCQEPEYILDKKKQVFNRQNKASEIRMFIDKESVLKLRSHLDHIIENMNSIQAICDSTHIKITKKKA